MTTIQGSISKLVDNSKVMLESLGYISTNLANYNTDCYKAQRFETYMSAGGSVRGVVRTDQSAGDQVSTRRDLDVAIDGAGFIPITNKKGETAYTRGGAFAVNSEGYIVANGGWLVGSGIKLPANYEKIKIKTNGSVLVQKSKESSFKKIGKIPLVVFKNSESLEIEEGSIMKETKDSGKPELMLAHSKIHQGKIERANFDPYTFISKTLAVNGSMLSSSAFIRIIDRMYRESINLKS